jgi:hypothetical protein
MKMVQRLMKLHAVSWTLSAVAGELKWQGVATRNGGYLLYGRTVRCILITWLMVVA